MSERAYRLEGFDDVNRRPIQVELRLITTSDEEALPASFAAPRGFLPEGHRNGGQPADPTGRAAELEVVVASGFRAPRGFLAL